MKVVILAAGRGTRMRHLTSETPKPMITVHGKPMLAYKLEALPPEIDGVILVVGYRQSAIEQFFGNSYDGRGIAYAVQEELNGTAAALHTARDLVSDRFLVVMGDDLYDRNSLIELCTHKRAMLTYHVKEARNGAKVISGANGKFITIDEHGDMNPGDLINTGAYVLDADFFELPMTKLPNGEYGLPQTLASSAASYGIDIVSTDRWEQISSPEDLERAAAWL